MSGIVVARLDIPFASLTLHLHSKYQEDSEPLVVYQWYIVSIEEFKSDEYNLQSSTITDACKNLTNYAIRNNYLLTWISI